MNITYALVANGIVDNVIVWDGVEYNEETGEGWSPPAGVTAIKLEAEDIANIGLGYVDGTFEQPAPTEPPQLTPEEILAANTTTKNALLADATLQIAPLQDAVDLGDATPAEVALLNAWKQYRVAVNRVDLTLVGPIWPAQP